MKFGLTVFVDTKIESREYCGECPYQNYRWGVCGVLFDDSGQPHKLEWDKDFGHKRLLLCRQRSGV